MAPGKAQLRPAMAEQHQRPLALFGDLHGNAVRRHNAMLSFQGHDLMISHREVHWSSIRVIIGQHLFCPSRLGAQNTPTVAASSTFASILTPPGSEASDQPLVGLSRRCD